MKIFWQDRDSDYATSLSFVSRNLATKLQCHHFQCSALSRQLYPRPAKTSESLLWLKKQHNFQIQ